MCGICYVKRFDGKSAQRMVLKRYSAQKTRGSEGFGYVAIDDGHTVSTRHSASEKEIKESIERESANEILFHHRYPTSTPNFSCAAHPIIVDNEKLKYRYSVVHNGIIYNDTELRTTHLKEGYEYTTEIYSSWISKKGNFLRNDEVKWNDSESLAIELAKDLDGDTPKGLGHIRGSIAFIALQIEKGSNKVRRLYYGRNASSPLMFHQTKEFTSICSEGKGVDVDAHTLWYYDYENEKNMSYGKYTIGSIYNSYPVTYPVIRYEAEDHIGFRRDDVPAKSAILHPEDTIFDKDNGKSYLSFQDEYYKLLEYKIELEEIIKEYNPKLDKEGDLLFFQSELEDTEEKLEEYEFVGKEINR